MCADPQEIVEAAQKTKVQDAVRAAQKKHRRYVLARVLGVRLLSAKVTHSHTRVAFFSLLLNPTLTTHFLVPFSSFAPSLGTKRSSLPSTTCSTICETQVRISAAAFPRLFSHCKISDVHEPLAPREVSVDLNLL